MMMLENGGSNVETTKNTVEHDTLTNTRRVKPITLLNKYSALLDEKESDYETDEEVVNKDKTDKDTLPNLNRRQRTKQKKLWLAAYTNTSDNGLQCPAVYHNADQNNQNNHTTTQLRRPHNHTITRTTTTRARQCEDHEEHEHVRDAVASSDILEEDWIGTGNAHSKGPHTTNTIHITTIGNVAQDVAQDTNLGVNCNYKWDRLQSHVNCPFILRRQSSQCRRRKCKSSSGLLVGTDHHCHERVRPHEWPLYRGEMREVMPPHQEPPTAKLHRAERVEDNHLPRELLQHPRGCPAYPGGYPSIGTWPSPIEGRGSRGQWRAHTQTDIAAKCVVTRVGGRDHCHCPGSLLVRGQPQPRRCEGPESATQDPLVVAPACAEGRPRERRVGWSPSATGPWTESTQDGYRKPPVELHHQHSDKGLSCPGGGGVKQ